MPGGIPYAPYTGPASYGYRITMETASELYRAECTKSDPDIETIGEISGAAYGDPLPPKEDDTTDTSTTETTKNTAAADTIALLVGFSAGQVQYLDLVKKDTSKLFNEEVSPGGGRGGGGAEGSCHRRRRRRSGAGSRRKGRGFPRETAAFPGQPSLGARRWLRP